MGWERFTLPSTLTRMRRWYWRLRSFWNLRRLMKSRQRILVIGDSHALSLAESSPVTRMWPVGGRASDGLEWWALWLGPRLAYSIARDGFPLVARIWSRFFPSLLIQFGEIDCRTRFVGRPESIGTTALGLLGRAIDQIGASTTSCVYLCAPPAPSVGYMSKEYPVAGSLSERSKVWKVYCSYLNLESQKRDTPFLEFPSLLVMDGALARGWTDDGCHVNTSGASIWRSSIAGSLAIS